MSEEHFDIIMKAFPDLSEALSFSTPEREPQTMLPILPIGTTTNS